MTDEQKKPPALIFVVTDAPADAFTLPADPDKKTRPISPGTMKYVLVELVSHFNKRRNGDLVWPSMARLGALTGLGLNTVRAALHGLHQLEFIKIRTDFGKSNGYSLNEEIIRSRLRPLRLAERAAADPSHHGRGKTADPSHHGGGTPPTMGGDPSHHGTRRDQGRGQGNSQPEFPSLAVQPFPKVVDGDHQRKLAVHGLIAQTAEKLRVTNQEQPTKNKPEPEVPALAVGARRVRERPG